MDNLRNLIGVEKIESMFSEDINHFYAKKEDDKRNFITKLKIKHLYYIPSFLHKRIYRMLPRILKDIFFWLSVIHKSPSSKIFARTKYDELRTLIDIKISALALRGAPANILNNVKHTFNSGFYTSNLPNISELDTLIDNVINYAKPSHAGARPYFKDGKNKKIDGSFSAYYDFSEQDSQKITLFLNKSLDEDFNYHLSALTGYKCELKDISYSLGIVFGENSNSEMHQDTYSSIAKGFIYLQDINDGNSPFEYLEGSYLDASFRSFQTNKAVMNNDFYSSGSTRLRGKVLEDAINKYELNTFTGSKGLFILANVSGYHRKGAHNSTKPRITLGFEIKRRGLVGKLLINLFAIIKFKLSQILNSYS